MNLAWGTFLYESLSRYYVELLVTLLAATHVILELAAVLSFIVRCCDTPLRNVVSTILTTAMVAFNVQIV